jgi:glycosyltransferase involved in cell wall biosynthesis
MSHRFSFIVPFHRGLASLERCLAALDPLPPASELIVAADGAVDDCRQLASAHGARVISLGRCSGPAVARNVAAAAASGDVLVFIDADVVVSRSGLERMARIFCEQPQTTAVFGSYDEQPGDPGFMSQYKNLSHAFIHRSSATRARTFWAGFGAVRRNAFHAVGGFDERFARPTVEDIDFGYRLTNQRYEILLDPSMASCHLKTWTVRSSIVSDVRDRGIPWTQLLLRYDALTDDLNLRTEYRLSVLLAYLAVLSLVCSLYDRRILAAIPPLMVALTVLNLRYYRFFYRMRGAWFAVRVWWLHGLHHLCNGASAAIGTALYVAQRHVGVMLPGALPLDPWSAARARSAPADGTPNVWSANPASD